LSLTGDELNPDDVLSTIDSGDDMQLRVRYQATYAALIALGMLLDATEIVEIYCEHHEDVLVRKANGKYQGCQVKTRLPSLGPFKADDQQITSALSRFVGLDIEFPNIFERFVIASNVGFWRGTENSKNLPYLIELSKASNGSVPKASREIHKLIAGLCSSHECKRTVAWAALARVELQAELPQFHDIEKQLAVQIGTVLGATSRRFDELMNAAKGLVQLIGDASSRNHTNPLFQYFVFLQAPGASEERAIIEAKRISKDRLLAVIKQSFDDAVLLCSGNRVDVTTLPKGMTRIEKKMAAGGIPSCDVELVKDLKFSMDKLLQEWMYKYGPEEASKRYDHLQLIVKDDCFEASGHTKASGPYGPAMLARIRSNLKDSAKHHRSQLAPLGISYNHLLGVTGILTEDCKVWWTDPFDVTNDGSGDAT
jgi:hypothetical protein